MFHIHILRFHGSLNCRSEYGPYIAALLLFTHVVLVSRVFAQPYVQNRDVVYGETDGIGLLMDVFVPSGEKNGLAVVDVVSGAWYSDRDKIRDHERAQAFHILCGKGYTVFAVRPGSLSKFGALEMVDHVQRGIRWVKRNAADYRIDPQRLGLMGASAGGHLACLAAVTAAMPELDTDGDEGSGEVGTQVKATAVFFPPTDFLDYGGEAIDVRSDIGFGAIVKQLAFPLGLDGISDDAIVERIKRISPAHLVTAETGPFLLIHGNDDDLVPLQQSERMVAALQARKISVELIIKNGGGHPWPTLHEEVKVMAGWFDRQLTEGPTK